MPETQRERFMRTARELGCDEDPEAFKRALRQISKAPPAPRDKAKKADGSRSRAARCPALWSPHGQLS